MSILIKGINLLIKGIKMPKLGKIYKVMLYKAVDGRIIVSACGVRENVYHPIGEAVEIKTPHGRLIDADAIQDYNVETFGQRLLIIDTAPTVIEAEGSEE